MLTGNRVLRFDEYEVDLDGGEVRRNGGLIRLQEKPFQVLTLLLETPGKLVTREAIRERLWGTETYIEFDDSLNHAIRKLRDALEDSAEKPRFIETKPRRGYRFVAVVEGGGRSAGRRYVGRDREIAELRRWVEGARDNGGSMFCISGEAGVGKTTLAEAFLSGLSVEHDSSVACGRCSERLVGTDAYLPILDILEDMLRRPYGHAAAAILKATAPSWCVELSPALISLDSVDSAAQAEARASSQERKKREFAAFLQALARERPVVLFLDDLHWADVSTVDLLSYLVPRCSTVPVSILGAYRASDLALARHPFLELKRELQAHRQCREVELVSLGLKDVQSYIELEFPGNTFPPNFADAIFEPTEGHALFVVDLLSDFVDAGIVTRANGSWELARPLAELRQDLPESVRGMVERKLGHLSEGQRRVLEAASVEGHEFHSAVLARVLGVDAAAVEESLDDLHERHRLVRFSGEREFPDSTFTVCYTFEHALYQGALLGKQRPTRRAALSGSTAEALAAFYRGREADIASRLGYLYQEARDWDRASEFLLIAARSAAKQSAYRESSALALRAIETANRLDGTARDRRTLEATLQLARGRQSLSDWERSISDFESASLIAEASGDVRAQVEALCGSAISAGYLKRTEEMWERTMRAFEVARTAGAETAYPESLLGYQCIFVGDLARSREYHERAIPVLTRHGPSPAGILAATSLGFLHHLQSEYREAECALADAIAQMQSVGEWADLPRATWFQGIVLANQGRTADALEVLRRGMRAAELSGDRYWLSRFPNTIGWVHAEMGDLNAAERFNKEGVVAGQKANTPEAEANAHINLANVFVTRQEFDRAWAHLCEGERILNREDHQHWLRWRFRIRLSLELAGYWFATGDLERARASAKSALARASESFAPKHQAAAHKLLGDIAVLEDQNGEARGEYTDALSILQAHPCPYIEWKTLRAAGNLASRCGDRSRAEHLLRVCAAKVSYLAEQAGSASLTEGFLRSSAVPD
jgi:DNA-binding winged helix-turn-helix (wHTH) protein